MNQQHHMEYLSMKKYLNTLLALALVTIVAIPAWAEHGEGKHQRKSPEEIFKMMDANGDGNVTLDEFKAHHEQMKAKWAEKREEWKAKRKQHKADDAAGADENAEKAE